MGTKLAGCFSLHMKYAHRSKLNDTMEIVIAKLQQQYVERKKKATLGFVISKILTPDAVFAFFRL